MLFKVTVIAVQEDEDVEQGANLGTVTISADSRAAAEAAAFEELWDSRLDSASCLAVYETTLLPQYLVAEGWSHLFEGFGEKVVRFVFDREAKRIVDMDICLGSWRPVTRIQVEDVEDSLLNANPEALVDPESYGLVETSELPHWSHLEKPVLNTR